MQIPKCACIHCQHDLEAIVKIDAIDGLPSGEVTCPHCGQAQEFLEEQPSLLRRIKCINRLLVEMNRQNNRRIRVQTFDREKPSNPCLGCRETMPTQPHFLFPILPPDRIECPHCGLWQHYRHADRGAWCWHSAARLMTGQLALLLTWLATHYVWSQEGLRVGRLLLTLLVYAPLLAGGSLLLTRLALGRLDSLMQRVRRRRKRAAEYSWGS